MKDGYNLLIVKLKVPSYYCVIFIIYYDHHHWNLIPAIWGWLLLLFASLKTPEWNCILQKHFVFVVGLPFGALWRLFVCLGSGRRWENSAFSLGNVFPLQANWYSPNQMVWNVLISLLRKRKKRGSNFQVLLWPGCVHAHANSCVFYFSLTICCRPNAEFHGELPVQILKNMEFKPSESTTKWSLENH